MWGNFTNSNIKENTAILSLRKSRNPQKSDIAHASLVRNFWLGSLSRQPHIVLLGSLCTNAWQRTASDGESAMILNLMGEVVLCLKRGYYWNHKNKIDLGSTKNFERKRKEKVKPWIPWKVFYQPLNVCIACWMLSVILSCRTSQLRWMKQSCYRAWEKNKVLINRGKSSWFIVTNFECTYAMMDLNHGITPFSHKIAYKKVLHPNFPQGRLLVILISWGRWFLRLSLGLSCRALSGSLFWNISVRSSHVNKVK